MNKSQITHLVVRLNEMATKKFPDRWGRTSVVETPPINSLSVSKLIEFIKADKIVASPDSDNHYGVVAGGLCYKKDFKVLLEEYNLKKKMDACREIAWQEIKDIEDQLVFENVSNVAELISGFEAKLDVLLK